MKKNMFLLFFFSLPFAFYAQSTTTILATDRNRTNILTEIPSELGFRELGLGVGLVALKDEATSPLIYQGIAYSFTTNKVKRNTFKESHFGTRLVYGIPMTNVGEEWDFGEYLGLDVYYTYLRNIPKLSFANTSVLVGGTLDVTSVVRHNYSFFNNMLGLDFFPTLMGSVKLNKSFIGKSAWHHVLDSPFLRWLGSKKPRPKVHQELSFQADIGLVNTNFRNGYAYLSHAPVYNDNNFVKDHEFHWFSGFRIVCT